MSLMAGAPVEGVVYPDRDGRPMADNTKQARWMAMLFGNLCALFRETADVFVAMDLLWYAVQGLPEIRTAPDVFVVFGRPKGDRGSYRQWEEGGVAPQVVFEILSPGKSGPEMVEKFAFYEDHGVEEYYIYNPDTNRIQVFVRRGDVLARVRMANGFKSPRVGIRFDLSGPELSVHYPDGQPFLTFEELSAKALRAEQRAADVQRRADRQAELMRRVMGQQATAEELQELRELLAAKHPSS